MKGKGSKGKEKPKWNFWLWLFLIGLVLGASSLFSILKSDFVFVSLISIPLFIITFIKMLNERKNFVTWAILSLWISFGLVLITLLIFENFSLKILLILMVNVGWTIYLKTSERVKKIFVD